MYPTKHFKLVQTETICRQQIKYYSETFFPVYSVKTLWENKQISTVISISPFQQYFTNAKDYVETGYTILG